MIFSWVGGQDSEAADHNDKGACVVRCRHQQDGGIMSTDRFPRLHLLLSLRHSWVGTGHDHSPVTTDDANDAETDPKTIRTEGAAGVGARTGIGETETVIQTKNRRSGNTVVGVGMGPGVTNGRLFTAAARCAPK